MPEPEETIAHCHSCGNAMDVSAVAPFSNVECPTCGVANRVKRDFGHYTLTRRLAEGGMSLVFVAMDNTLGREVALKILNEDYSVDERRIQAFEEEARITASFSHPHVVRVFTTGRAFGRFYIAMELVPGGHFEHQIRERGKIPEIEILPFAMQVAEGLEAARAAGLIHRDVKPGNILLDSQGSAKIVDFGLALVTKGGSATAQEIWATPYYVPPETIEGHAEDFRSDLYAFGATLYHALAGKPPCDEQSMATDVLRQAKKHIKPLRSAAPDVSDETCAIIDKAMAYDPKARFSSYEEMIRQLGSALKRIKKGGGTSSGNLKRKTSRRVEWLAVGAAGVLLLAAIGGGIAWIARDEPVKSDPQPLLIQTPGISEEPGNATLIGQRYRAAREAVKTGDYEKARETFAALRDDADVQEPTRTWAAR
jgi:serine/threonine protein kinase